MRVCSFYSSGTEILYALGLGDSLVARSSGCRYPPEVDQKPVVVRPRIHSDSLTSRQIDDEVKKLTALGEKHYIVDTALLKRLEPDLLIIDELCDVCAAGPTELDIALKSLDRRPSVVTLNISTLEGIFSAIEKLGSAVGKTDKARQLASGLKKEIQEIGMKVQKVSNRPRVWCCEWLDPLWVAGHWIPEIVEQAGGQDGLGKARKSSYRVDWDKVRQYDPEVIFVMPCSFKLDRTLKERQLLERLPGWSEVSAVRQGRVWALETGYFHSSGPRLVTGLKTMASILQPQLFEKPSSTYAKVLAS